MCECFRCGTCCKGFLAMVPKTDTSNLSPEYLESLFLEHDLVFVTNYVDENSEFQGDRCKWLKDEPDGTTSCVVYDKRSSDCRNYPDPTITTRCRVGALLMSK